jgi:cytochrome b involved in lipid metabolism
MATFPHLYKVTKETCVISIDGKSYDVSSWRNYHPGGAESLDNFNNRDATEAFYALHSKEAIQRLKSMGSKPTDMSTLINQPTKAALAFREFR